MPSLSPKQRQVVAWDQGDVLVTGRAGTGKTLVLARHAARVLADQPAERLWFLTGTDAAARRVQGLLQAEVGKDTASCRVTTLEALSATMLRTYGEQIGMERFGVLDGPAAMEVAAHEMERLGYQASDANVHNVYREIRRSEGLRSEREPLYCGRDVWSEVRPAYERALDRMQVVDKGGLVQSALQLLTEYPSVLDGDGERGRMLYVDDIQNYTEVEVALIRLLVGSSVQVLAASDPDTRIHPDEQEQGMEEAVWEGRDMPEGIRLERSFRSSPPLTQIAPGIVGEPYEAEISDPERVVVVKAATTDGEAEVIADRIEKLRDQGVDYPDMAVFTRDTLRCGSVAERLRENGIPVRGDNAAMTDVRRDVLAYLQVAAHPHDDVRLLRVINVPSRGVGPKTRERLRRHAVEAGVSAWTAIRQVDEIDVFGSRVRRTLSSFRSLLKPYVERAQTEPPPEWVGDLVEDTGYLRSVTRTNTQEQLRKREHVEAIVRRIEASSADTVDTVLQHERLRSAGCAESDGVTVCRLREAVGLEFSVVFIAGMEEGVFPDETVMQREPLLNADRRLLSMGIARAEGRLCFTWAGSRTERGQQVPTTRSRFLDELDERGISFEKGRRTPGGGDAPSGGYDDVDPHYFRRPLRARQRRQSADPGPTVEDAQRVREGQRIEHPSLGTGTVVETKTEDDGRIAVIEFDDRGEKSINLKYATLTVINDSSAS